MGLLFGAHVLGLALDRLVFDFVAIACPQDYEIQRETQINCKGGRETVPSCDDSTAEERLHVYRCERRGACISIVSPSIAVARPAIASALTPVVPTRTTIIVTTNVKCGIMRAS